MSTKTILTLIPLLAATALPSTAQDNSFGERLQPEIRFSGMRFDNFFQAPEGNPKDEVTVGRVEGRLVLSLPGEKPWEVYGRGRYSSYEGSLEDSMAVGAGVRYDGRPRSLDVYLQYEVDRPTLDVGDEFDRADVVRLAGEYSHRLAGDWQVSGLLEAEHQEFDLVRSKDNDLYGAGAAVRYRGWGYVLSPEIGVLVGERDAVDPNQDHDQRDVWLKLRSLPVSSLYLSLRYRVRRRDYSVGDPGASNFGREDDRRQWTLAADLKTGALLTWNLYYSFQDADSTKDSRTFESQLLSLGVTLGF